MPSQIEWNRRTKRACPKNEKKNHTSYRGEIVSLMKLGIKQLRGNQKSYWHASVALTK